jgi:hypothetical protein
LEPRTERTVFLVVFAIVVYLSFTGLAGNCFWDDEAHVGFFAENLNATGHFSGWTGRNLLTYRNGSPINDEFNSRNPPLDYLVTALSFRFLGSNTWTARFPFVLAGLITLVVFWALLKIEFGIVRRARVYGFILYALSYSFLLNIRQCRYYSLCMLFSVVSFFIYKKCIHYKTTTWFVSLALSLSLLFFSNYLLFACFTIALLGSALIFNPFKTVQEVFWKTCTTVLILAAIVVPYAVCNRIWIRPDMPGQTNPAEKVILLFWNIRELDTIGYFPVLFIVPALLYLFLKRRSTTIPSALRQWIFLAGFYILFLSVLSPQHAQWTGIKGGLADIRYLVVCLPFASGIVGCLLACLPQWMGGTVSFFILAVMLCSNILSLRIGNPRIRLLLPGFVRESHTPQVTPYKAAVSYLLAHTKQDDTIVTLPDYTSHVLLYYMGDKVKIGGLLNDRTRLPMDKLAKLNAPVVASRYFPNWIICFGLKADRAQWLYYFSRGKYSYGCDSAAAYFGYHHMIPVFWEERTRPELPWHSFRPKKKFNLSTEAVYIFKRSEKAIDTADSR